MTISAGVDVGATLAKIAVRRGGAPPEFSILPARALDRVCEALKAAEPERVGLTGAGASALAKQVPADAVTVTEFAAWGAGAASLLERDASAVAGERYLLVSLGTGTSVMLKDGMAVNRIGGTALGGGTILGLSAALLGVQSFEELVALAAAGARGQVDLLVSDLYRPGEIALAGDLTAANFGKLAVRLAAGETPAKADLAHALMGLVGENVALVCAGLGAALQVNRVVFGGSTLRGNEPLVEILRQISTATGASVTFLPDGEFAGALGALELAAA